MLGLILAREKTGLGTTAIGNFIFGKRSSNSPPHGPTVMRTILLAFFFLICFPHPYCIASIFPWNSANNKFFTIWSSNEIRIVSMANDSVMAIDTVRVLKDLDFAVDLFELQIVDPSSGIQFYKNGILYLQDSKESSKDIRISFGTLDTYVAAIDGLKPRAPAFFSNQFAFPFPSEAISFTGDYSAMYFTKKSNFKGTAADIVKIYQSEYIESASKKKSGWSENIQPLPFNGDDFSCTQPSVSPDGTLLIFASDRPGGQGKMDLYLARFENGIWSDPRNLGDEINTPEDENFPFLLNAKTLFFSSNGHHGIGGYDIYISKFEDGVWIQPVNLGNSINTDMDEIAFTMNHANQEVGFFSSNRNLFKKEMQIFKVSLISGRSFLNEDTPFKPSDLAYLTISREHPGEQDSITFIADIPEKEPAVDTIQEPIDQEETKETITPPINIVTHEQPIKSVREAPDDIIDFRVQFKASASPLGEFPVNIDGTTYTAHEYFYKGAYRYTLGEFSTAQAAYELQNKCRQVGYRDAFVAIFQNNERILKMPKETQTEEPEMVEPKPVEITPKPETEPQITKQGPQETIDFRVQFKASAKSLGAFEVTIGGVAHTADEYFYKGVFRYTLGKFGTPQEAYELQKKCRQAGYRDAFVAAFKNNERTLDPKVFEKFR
jgi:hypothetical protein